MTAVAGSMLSVIIATHESERPLVHTLAALIPGATAGLVHQVIVADGGSRDETAAVADVAGCHFHVTSGSAGARFNCAAASARAPWLLFLRAGVVLDRGWINEARSFIEEEDRRAIAEPRAATFRAGSARYRSPIAQGLALIVHALHPLIPPGRGLLIAKRLYDTVGGYADMEDCEPNLLRRLGRRRVVTLHATATAAQ